MCKLSWLYCWWSLDGVSPLSASRSRLMGCQWILGCFLCCSVIQTPVILTDWVWCTQVPYSLFLYRFECQVSPGPPLTGTLSLPALNHHLPHHSEDAQQEKPCRNGFCVASYSPLMLHNMQPFSLAGTRGEQLHLCERPTQAPRQLQWSSWCTVTCIHTPWRNTQQFCRSSWGSNSCQREGLLP